MSALREDQRTVPTAHERRPETAPPLPLLESMKPHDIVPGAEGVAAPAAVPSPADAQDTERLPTSLPALRARITRHRVQFRREERRLLRERLSVGLAVALSWFAWSLPPRVRRFLVRLAADSFYRCSEPYRANVQANLRQVLGPGPDQAALERTARSIFHVSSANFLDLILTPRRPARAFIDHVRMVEGDWSDLDAVLAEGKGAIIVTAHLGAFDYIGQALFARGYRMTTVTGRTTSRFVFDGVSFLRRSRGAEIVEATPSGIRRAVRALRRGDLAAFATDRDFFGNGKPATFFGRATTLPPGAVRIARDTGAPLVPAFARREGDGYGFALHPPLRIERTKDLEADVAKGLAQLVAALELAIGRSPEQWVMFQRVWPEE